MLPHASGIAIARTPRMIGAFHGAMPTITPTGSRIAMAMQPGLSDGMTSPPICVVIAAASRMILAANIRLNPAHGGVAPISSTIAVTKASLRASNSFAALLSRTRRAVGPTADHAGNAAAAASQAASTSASVAAALVVATAPVTGLWRSKVRAGRSSTRLAIKPLQ